MALFNEILVGRLNRWCQKFYAIKSGTASLTQLVPTVQTTNQILSGVEDLYLQNWQRYQFTVTSPAVAAQSSEVQLRNPVGSAVVAVVTKLNALPGATSLVQAAIFNQPSDLASIVSFSANRMDRRGQPAPVCVGSFGASASLPGTFLSSFRELGTTTAPETPFIVTTGQEITILPGDCCAVFCELVNTAISVAFQWRERPLESSELT